MTINISIAPPSQVRLSFAIPSLLHRSKLDVSPFHRMGVAWDLVGIYKGGFSNAKTRRRGDFYRTRNSRKERKKFVYSVLSIFRKILMSELMS